VKLAIHYIKKNNVVNGTAVPSRGSIICTASNAGIYAFPVAPLYAASKSGVIGLVRGLAKQLEKLSIQINGLAPAVLGVYSARHRVIERTHDFQKQTLRRAKTFSNP
jgi:NAD(P)-dependent dehydrogenase (short-subunit alcohol dehydrogenase family)